MRAVSTDTVRFVEITKKSCQLMLVFFLKKERGKTLSNFLRFDFHLRLGK